MAVHLELSALLSMQLYLFISELKVAVRAINEVGLVLEHKHTIVLFAAFLVLLEKD